MPDLVRIARIQREYQERIQAFRDSFSLTGEPWPVLTDAPVLDLQDEVHHRQWESSWYAAYPAPCTLPPPVRESSPEESSGNASGSEDEDETSESAEV